MAQSTLEFEDTTTINLNINELTDNNNIPITEQIIIPDPTDYSTPNSVLSQAGNIRRTINITGDCTNVERAYIKTAFKNGEKVEPTIYPPPNSAVNLTPTSYYYVKDFNCTYIPGVDKVYYKLTLIFGGTT